MVELAEVITYPTEHDNWIVTTLIGGVLLFFSFLVIPMFLVYGYLVRVVRAVTADEPEPPGFGDWGALLVEGVQAWIIALIYLLIPLIVGALTIGGSIAAMATGTDVGAAAGLGGSLVGVAVTLLLTVVFGYVSVAAIVNFAREERFGAGFEFGVLKQAVLTDEFAIAWLLSLLLFIVAGVVNVIPLLGWVLAPFIGFYVAVVAANLWADGFARAVAEA